MGELQKKMLMKMELRNLSKRTIGIYLFHMRRFVKYYGISPDKLGVSEVEEYLHTFYENKKSISSLVQAHGAIKFFYKEVLGKEEVVSKILRPKIEKKIPVVLSKEEVKKKNVWLVGQVCISRKRTIWNFDHTNFPWFIIKKKLVCD